MRSALRCNFGVCEVLNLSSSRAPDAGWALLFGTLGDASAGAPKLRELDVSDAKLGFRGNAGAVAVRIASEVLVGSSVVCVRRL